MNNGLKASFTKRFSAGPVVQVDDLTLPTGSGITVLFGASGSGKTTVLRCLAGLERPETGTISYDGEVWLDADRRTFLSPQRRHIGLVPQEYALFPHLPVDQNIAYGLQALPDLKRGAQVEEKMHWLGLDGLETRFPHELSGGQQQRVALARALVTHPRLLLLDEPLSALDAPTRTKLRTELRRLLQQTGIPTLLVTHDRLEALALGDAMVVMDGGKILQQGSVHDVFSRPDSRAVAEIVAVETVQPSRVIDMTNGLATVTVGTSKLVALARDLPEGTREAYVCIRAEDVILAKGADANASPRNQLAATVRAISREGPMVRITLDCGFPLMALLTTQACEEMSLTENARVVALLKAPNIHVIPR